MGKVDSDLWKTLFEEAKYLRRNQGRVPLLEKLWAIPVE